MYIFLLTTVYACLSSAYLSVFIGGVFWVVWNLVIGQLFAVAHIPFYQLFTISFVLSVIPMWLKIKDIVK